MFQKFWDWYERHYTLNVTLAAFLFFWQIVHLFWLATSVIAQRFLGEPLIAFNQFWELVIILVDYTEIPAIITTSFVYINQLRRGRKALPITYLILLHSQWLHIFWITDEFVVDRLGGEASGTILPAWLAWIAISIDYLELPIIYDTIKRSITALKSKFIK